MPAESLIAVDGFLRTLPDGSLVTDRNGAPCCCGGGPGGCCICVDTGQPDPEKLCYPFYTIPPEWWCNPVKSCCCGTRVRVVWTRNATYFNRTDTPGVGFKQKDGKWDERAVYEVAVKYGPNGECVGFVFTYLEYDWTNYNHQATEDGESDTLQENHDPNSIKGMLIGRMGGPHSLCRPEPVELSVALLGGGNSPYGGDWSALFQAGGCSGEQVTVDNTPPNTFLNITRWQSKAACRTLNLTAVIDNEFADQWSSGTRDVTQKVTMALTVLEDTCCPPAPFSTAFQPFGPVNPAIPGIGNPGVQAGGCGSCGEDGGAGIGAELP